MWPIPSREKEIVTVALGRRHIYCNRFQKSPRTFPLHLIAQRTYQLPEHAIGEHAVFHQSAIIRAIRSFLDEQEHPHARLTIALSPPQIKSAIITQSSTQSGPYHGFDEVQSGWNWQYQYLYPDETGGFVHYACGIPHTLRFQWHLMASQAPFNLVTLTSGSMALLALYEALCGSAFRRTQFADRMQRNHNVITRLFSPEMAKRVVYPYPEQSMLPLLVNCGLFISELDEA